MVYRRSDSTDEVLDKHDTDIDYNYSTSWSDRMTGAGMGRLFSRLSGWQPTRVSQLAEAQSYWQGG